MDPLAFLGKLFKRKKLPITPKDIMDRAPSLDKYIQWSRNKRILVFNPPFWGFHDIFVDSDLNHALVCIKESKEAFIISGNTKGGEKVFKFNSDLTLESEEELTPGLLEWIIFDDYVIYRGPFLPLGRDPYYIGKIAAAFPFTNKLNYHLYPDIIAFLKEWYTKASKGRR